MFCVFGLLILYDRTLNSEYGYVQPHVYTRSSRSRDENRREWVGRPLNHFYLHILSPGNGNGSGNRIARSRDDMGYTDRRKQINMGESSTETERYITDFDSRVQSSHFHSIGSQITSSHTALTISQISRVTAHRKHTTVLNTWTAAVHTSQHCMAASNHTSHHQFRAQLQQSTEPARKFKGHTNTSTHIN